MIIDINLKNEKSINLESTYHFPTSTLRFKLNKLSQHAPKFVHVHLC